MVFVMRRLILFLVLMMLILSLPVTSCLAVDEFIKINPFLKKIPLAIPEFKPLSEDAPSQETSTEAAQLLAESLLFTGYFKVVDKGAYLEDPRQSGITDASINYRNWTVIGAELLITGGIRRTTDAVEMELRLFDTFKGQSVIGKRYRGRSQRYPADGEEIRQRGRFFSHRQSGLFQQ